MTANDKCSGSTKALHTAPSAPATDGNSTTHETNTQADPTSRAALDRHRRKCKICHHPERETIEQDYLHWRSPFNISKEYGLTDHSTIHRHAHATRLHERRRANVRMALDAIIEEAESVVDITPDVVIRAIRVYAHINDAGEWFEPTTTHIVASSSSGASSTSQAGAPSQSNPPSSNPRPQELELVSTH